MPYGVFHAVFALTQLARLQRTWRGSNTWKQVKTTTTTSQYGDGTYTSNVKAARNATFRVVYAGETRTSANGANTATFSASRDSAVSWLRRKIGSDVVEPRPNRMFLKGKVRPGGRQTVQLMRKACKKCSWKQVGKQRTTRLGTFRFAIDAPRNGSWFYRARTPATKKHVVSF